MNANDRNDFVNVVDYSDEYSVFSDFSSAIGLSPASTDAVGVHRLFFKGLNTGSILPTLEPVARPFVRASNEDGDWEHVAELSCESRIDGWTQVGATSRYLVVQNVRFLDATHVHVSWDLSLRWPSDTDSSKIASPEFGILGAIYPGQAELLDGAVKATSAQLVFRKGYHNVFLDKRAECLAETVWQFASKNRDGWDGDLGEESEMRGGFRTDEAIPSLGPNLQHLASKVSGERQACWWLSTSPVSTNSFEPNWRVELTISVTFREAQNSTLELAELKSSPSTRGTSASTPYFDFDALPEPQPNSLYWKRKLRQSFATILGASVRHPGYGSFSEEIGFVASISNWSSTVWFWDHFISAVAVGAFRPEFMTSAVRCILRHTSGERIAPGILLAFPSYGADDHMRDCYAPIASWAVAKSWKANGRRPDLEDIYPLLAAHHEGWFRHCDRDGDGIPEWRNSGNPCDDSPRFDAYAPFAGAACFDLPPFPSADLCAYLLLDARCLSHFAAELGLHADVHRWEARADFLRKQLREKHWDPQELFFYDLDTEGRMKRVKTFFGLLPLWADPELLPAETARAAIRQHLLNPDEFWGEIPFPSVAYDEPTYDATGYWRGRTWGHVYYWNVELLHLHGFHEEAEEACRRYLRVAAAHKESMENFPSQPASLHARSVRSYSWCGAVTAYLLLGWHRSPVQALFGALAPSPARA